MPTSRRAPRPATMRSSMPTVTPADPPRSTPGIPLPATPSPSAPELPAVYFAAMRAGLILVPLDLRMSTDAIAGIVARAEPRHLILGTGRDAPDPASANLADFPTTTTDALTADPDSALDPA